MSLHIRKRYIFILLLAASYFIPSETEIMRQALYKNLITTRPANFENRLIISFFKFGSGSPDGYIPWRRIEFGLPMTVIKIDINNEHKIVQGTIDNFKAIFNMIFVSIIYCITLGFIRLQKWVDNKNA